MKKILKGILCAGMCAVLAFGAAGCSGNNGPDDPDSSAHRDAETMPLKLAIGAVDRKFNPFFYTSQNDGSIVGLTQAAMITTNAAGELSFGDDYPTVALDYQEIYTDKSGNTLQGTGDGKNVTAVPGQTISNDNTNTTYEFLIKNDMYFSDGEHKVTVMDVLFNLYVYLDRAYSGSSTIYSTKIQGLQAYRMQDNSLMDTDVDTSSNKQYYAAADTRIQKLSEWSEYGADPDELKNDEQLQKDLAQVKKRYEEELETDWSSASAGWEDTYKEYRFTEAWEAFYFMEQVITTQTALDPSTNTSKPLKDENDKYYTTLDEQRDIDGNVTGEAQNGDLRTEIEAAATPEKIADFMSKNEGYSEADAKLALQGAHAVKHTLEANSTDTRIWWILANTMTGATVREDFMLDAMSKDRQTDTLSVPTIKGITVDSTSKRGNKFNGKTYTEDHDILSIKINGIDPKAKWNFGFAVAPMYYYSDGSIVVDGIVKDNPNSKYYKEAMEDYEKFKAGTITEITHFGVKWKDANWMQDTLGATEKTRLPVGAGPYKCTSHSYSSDRYDPSKLTGDDFLYNNKAFFERNTSFDTMGKNVENAKIKYVTYQVMGEERILEALKTGTIDYGEPNATSDNLGEISQMKYMAQKDYLTGGYGYIGINPAAVPDLEVRQAIMHAFNTSSITAFYGNGLVEIINRPMSSTSWAYPKESKRYYELWTEEQQIRDLITSSEKHTWIYNEESNKIEDGSGNQLKLTFTIAGESTKHPAYRMLVNAANTLEKCGMDIIVTPDPQALTKLASGKLEVWAAAWSSSIDPDPYQIYSIYSNASSTKNWNKQGILESGENGEFSREYAIANELSDKIDEGRRLLKQEERIPVYHECLDLIMDLAVEFPTYQRKNLCVYDSRVLDPDTMHIADASFNMGPIDELWKVNYKK